MDAPGKKLPAPDTGEWFAAASSRATVPVSAKLTGDGGTVFIRTATTPAACHISTDAMASRPSPSVMLRMARSTQRAR